MKLEELKARSKDCGSYPRLIEIAREAQSPTAAYEWAKKNHFNDSAIKACRFLAIIKRDFSKKSFEKVSAEIQQEAASYMSHYFLLPIIQTTVRIEFLFNYLKRSKIESLKLAEHDTPYADIVEDCIQRIEKLPPLTQQQIIKSTSYLYEAHSFVENVRRLDNVDDYCLEKTFKILANYVRVAGKKSGIQHRSLCCYDTINTFIAGKE